MEKLIGFFRLARPANVVTAVSDILAGVAISGIVLQSPEYANLMWLVLSTMGLYGGGVVLNDVFDARLDAVERPERPIPSGLVPKSGAMLFGVLLLIGGIVFACLASPLSGVIAFVTATCAVVYDKYAKHHVVLGPVTMGTCRGLNLLLGISILYDGVFHLWPLAFVPVIYIAAITMISAGEVHGGKRSTMYVAAALYFVAMVCILYASYENGNLLIAAVFVLLWSAMVFLPLKAAITKPEGRLIGRAVKAGVLALILMNAAWAAAFGATYMALLIVLLLPLSILLAKAFAVT